MDPVRFRTGKDLESGCEAVVMTARNWSDLQPEVQSSLRKFALTMADLFEQNPGEHKREEAVQLISDSLLKCEVQTVRDLAGSAPAHANLLFEPRRRSE